MKKVIGLLAIVFLLGSCQKEEKMNLNKYEYRGSTGTYVVKLKTVDVRNVEVTPYNHLDEHIGADDIFKPLLDMVSMNIADSDTITLTILKNGVVFSEKRYWN